QSLDPNKPHEGNQDYVHYDPGHVQYEHGQVPHDQGHQHPPSFIPSPPPVNGGADEVYMVDVSKESSTSPYVGPTSYRDSISFPPGNPGSALAKSARSSVSHAPQYFPGGSVAVSDLRSPQTVSNVSPVL
ncbi:hypothetical protein BGZ96_004424, partial [Linnemannia gamsii]